MQARFNGECTATGWVAPQLEPGEKAKEILALIRLGQSFKAQQVGKRSELLSRLIHECAKRGGPPHSFAQLLEQLDVEARKRNDNGEAASPVEKVDRIHDLLTVHVKGVRKQHPFSTVRNLLTEARKKIRLDEFRSKPKP